MITLIAGTHPSLAVVTKLMQGVPWEITEVVTDCPTATRWARDLRRVPVHPMLARNDLNSGAGLVAIWDGKPGEVADAISAAKRLGGPCLVWIEGR